MTSFAPSGVMTAILRATISTRRSAFTIASALPVPLANGRRPASRTPTACCPTARADTFT
jgi:hypothetical protein